MAVSTGTAMKAIGQATRGDGEVDVLQVFHDAPYPSLTSERDIIVKVHATSVNPVDAKTRRIPLLSPARHHSAADPLILGFDAAGVVAAKGTAAHKFSVGDKIYFAGDVTRNGAHAEYVAVDERIAARKPHSLDWCAAAALPLVALTAWEGLVEHMNIAPLPDNSPRRNETILVIGGAGGVGSIVVQIANAVLGLTVIASASRPETEAWVRKMGAQHVVDHRKPMLEQIKALGFGGVNYIFNTADADASIAQWAELLLPLGKVVSILPPSTAQPDWVQFFLKRLMLAFVLMVARTTFRIGIEVHGETLKKLSELYDKGVLQRIDTETLNLWKDYKLAHQKIESGTTIGKIVLDVQ